ncbi:MAG TPA: hypothetical protein VD905_05980 [Flavobacteriales bacterium]|nr:hypothetical protein [Flavobacteriales bacterium]
MIKAFLIILIFVEIASCTPPGKEQPGKPDPDNPPRMHEALPLWICT